MKENKFYLLGLEHFQENNRINLCDLKRGSRITEIVISNRLHMLHFTHGLLKLCSTICKYEQPKNFKKFSPDNFGLSSVKGEPCTERRFLERIAREK